MNESIVGKVKRALQAADSGYYRLVLLVGESGSGKTGVLSTFADESSAAFINVNLALSSELLELTAIQRSLRLPVILDGITKLGQTTLVLDNLEILFDPILKQDPLRLLQNISRNRAVVASWNGSFRSGRLIYAEPGHPEYRRYDSFDAWVVCMDETAPINAATSSY